MEKVAKFSLQINSLLTVEVVVFVVVVVDLEQWTALKGAVSACLSYCRGTNLRRVRWPTGAST
jgi:hypothetical protein